MTPAGSDPVAALCRTDRSRIIRSFSMRKLILAALALFVSTGLLLAAQVTFVSYDKEKKTLKVKDGDEEKTYKLDDKTKYKQGDKDVDTDKVGDVFGKLTEGKSKLDVTVEKDVVTEVKFRAKKKN